MYVVVLIVYILVGGIRLFQCASSSEPESAETVLGMYLIPDVAVAWFIISAVFYDYKEIITTKFKETVLFSDSVGMTRIVE